MDWISGQIFAKMLRQHQKPLLVILIWSKTHSLTAREETFGGNCGKLRELMASLGVDGVAGNPHGNVLCLNSGWHKKEFQVVDFCAALEPPVVAICYVTAVMILALPCFNCRPSETM